jgi:hypothetical protein
MPGKLTTIEDVAAGLPPLKNPEEILAYCSGRDAAAAGGADTDNPYSGPDALLGTLWLAGFTSWEADPAGLATVHDCCARPYGGGYVPPEPPDPLTLFGPFDAGGVTFWIDLAAQEVRFDHFEPWGEHDLSVTFAMLATALASDPIRLGIIEAKIVEVQE